MVKIKNGNFHELAAVYNDTGKDGLYEQLRRTYGIKHPWATLSRMKKIPELSYDEENDKFLTESSKNVDDSLFMSMDELCSPMRSQHVMTENTRPEIPKQEAMESLIKELLGDRLLELSRYVIMNPLNKTMIIDTEALISAGYTLVTQ